MEYLSDFLQAWEDFQAQPYADTLLVAGGALLTLFAVIRIVRSSLAMLFWVLLAGGGVLAMMQGGGRAPWESRSLAGIDLGELVERRDDVLGILCERLRESRGEYRVSWPRADGEASAARLPLAATAPRSSCSAARPFGKEDPVRAEPSGA